jgi:hypothetical protein
MTDFMFQLAMIFTFISTFHIFNFQSNNIIKKSFPTSSRTSFSVLALIPIRLEVLLV